MLPLCLLLDGLPALSVLLVVALAGRSWIFTPAEREWLGVQMLRLLERVSEGVSAMNRNVSSPSAAG
jgi:hypothetical protein